MFLNSKYSINIKGTNRGALTATFILQYILHAKWLYRCCYSLFFNKIKCSTQPEPLVKWCVWVDLVHRGRAVRGGEQIRTSDLAASDRPRPFSTDRWGILNNSSKMRSHGCGARAALAPRAWAHPRCRERRSKPGSGTWGVWESHGTFWSRTDVHHSRHASRHALVLGTLNLCCHYALISGE